MKQETLSQRTMSIQCASCVSCQHVGASACVGGIIRNLIKTYFDFHRNSVTPTKQYDMFKDKYVDLSAVDARDCLLVYIGNKWSNY